jgi:prefoldin subunit 2
VTDVVPALETTLSGITEVLESLVKSYKTKEGEFMAFQKEYGIQVGLPSSAREGLC